MDKTEYIGTLLIVLYPNDTVMPEPCGLGLTFYREVGQKGEIFVSFW